METFEDNVRESQGLAHCKYAYVITGFAIRDSQPDQSFIDSLSEPRTRTVKLTCVHFHCLPLCELK